MHQCGHLKQLEEEASFCLGIPVDQGMRPLQVYELDSFKVSHATKYPGPILSVAISPNAALLAVGLADGHLYVRRHTPITRVLFLGCQVSPK